MSDQWHLLSVYTRAMAIADGVLVDVSRIAREAGIKFPTALTRAVWAKCVALPPDGYGGQDESGRLWDVVWMFRCAARGHNGDRIEFQLYVRNIHTDRVELITLKAICGPGDTAEPVITIMLPDED